MGRTDISRKAEEVLYRELQHGEHVVSRAEVTSNPSRWGIAAFLALVVAVVATGLVGFFGLVPHPAAGGFPAPLLLLIFPLSLFLRRPMLVVVTDQRLICFRLTRFGRAPRQVAFAVPLAEVRIVAYRPRRHVSAIQCEIPGHKRIWLDAGRAGREDFARVEEALTRAGAFAKLDPPWPAPQTPGLGM